MSGVMQLITSSMKINMLKTIFQLWALKPNRRVNMKQTWPLFWCKPPLTHDDYCSFLKNSKIGKRKEKGWISKQGQL